MLSESQLDRYSALLKRLKGLPADQREDVLRAMRATPKEDPSVLHYVSLYFRLPPEPDRCRTGERIGPFTLGAQLGSGGMGVVYHAQEAPPLERVVALKLIHPYLILTGESDAAERFQDEIQQLAKFEREGIARIYTAGIHTDENTGETLPFFTMELVRGGVPITAYAKAHALTMPERLRLFLRVCEAVGAAHQQLVIHRDLKPTNILVDQDGRPFVLDFGLAQICDSSRPHGGEYIAGTPPYMSPEQISDAFGPIEAMSDVYTLGFILYELLAGRRPLEVPPNTSWEALQQVILTTEPALLSQYNAECRGELESIVAKTLAKRPADRYPSVADLHRVIDHHLAWVERVQLERTVRPLPTIDAAEAVPQGGWTLDDLRHAARKASADYLDKMQRERIYLPHLYARRLELEMHLSGFLDHECTKTGMLIVGTSGIGKTNTLCHIVKHWCADAAKLGSDVGLFMGGSMLPGGNFALRDVLLDRLELSESFTTFLTVFDTMYRRDNAQFLLIIDGVDKHPQPAELLRQLDDLVIRGEALPWFKVIISISEVTYGAIRKGGFIPAMRDYYTVSVGEGAVQRESAEVRLGPMTDEELGEAYEKYRQEPGFPPTSPFESLTDEVKNAIRNPLFLRIVMEVFNRRKVPRRTFTAEVLLDYCTKKIFGVPYRAFFINRFTDLLYDNRWMVAAFDTLAQTPELRSTVLDASPQSPYLQLLDEQVLEEQFKRVSAILPPQHTVAFAHDRLFEYLLLNRTVERFGIAAEALAELSEQAQSYLPLRGALTMLFLAKADEGAFTEVAMLLEQGNPEVMTAVGLNLLMELEQMAPTTADTSDEALAASPVGCLVAAMLVTPSARTKSLLLDVGEKLQVLGFYRRAGFIYAQLLPWVDETAEPLIAAKLWRSLADVKSIFGQEQEAMVDYEKALGLCQTAGDRAGEQGLLTAIGEVSFVLGEMAIARDCYARSLAIARDLIATTKSAEGRKEEARTLFDLASYYYRTGESSTAMDYAERARQIRFEIEDKRGLGASLNQLGVLHRRQGRLGEALRCYQEALAFRQEIGDRTGIANSLSDIGNVYRTRGQTAEALVHYQQALAMHQEIGDKAGVAVALNNIALIYKRQGQIEQALSTYEQSLAILQEIGDKERMATSLSNIGDIYETWGQTEKALGHYQQALAMRQEIGDKAGVAGSLSSIGGVYRTRGQTAEALVHYQQALALRREIGTKSGIAGSLNSIGLIYKDTGQTAEALDYLQQALQLEEEIGDKAGVAAAFNNIAVIYYRQGQMEQALQTYERSLALDREMGRKAGMAIKLGNIGSIYWARGQTKEALIKHQQALVIRQEIGDKSGIASSLNSIGVNLVAIEYRGIRSTRDSWNTTIVTQKRPECPSLEAAASGA